MKLSAAGAYTLMEIEALNDYTLYVLGILVIKNGKLVGIRPINIGDGSVTVGFGHWIDPSNSKQVAYYQEKYGIRLDMTNERTKLGELQ